MSSFFQDIFAPLLCFQGFTDKFNLFSGTHLREPTMLNAICSSSDSPLCRDDSSALVLKLVALGSILVCGAVGIAVPLLGRHKRFLATDGNLFIAAKAFAAGVILATGFVHMLPDGSKNLTSACLPKYPWHKFPFSGFFAMMAALVTLLVDFLGTQLYERKRQRMRREQDGGTHEFGLDGSLDSASGVGVLPVDRPSVMDKDGKVFGGEESIVGIRAHGRAHGHAHAEDQNANGVVESREGHIVEVFIDDGHGHGHGHNHGHGHMHGFDGDNGARHAVVSQVLELGIISHSVLIGLSLGVSHSPCTIRPLIAALSFHQFFEGFALGGCIAQAQFRKMSTIIMACFFALTTPAGISVGIAVASSYNPSSVRALIVEGILDSISSGILIYMALVDLIAADFMSKRMRCNIRLQIVSYAALFLGASLMAALAIWS